MENLQEDPFKEEKIKEKFLSLFKASKLLLETILLEAEAQRTLYLVGKAHQDIQ